MVLQSRIYINTFNTQGPLNLSRFTWIRDCVTTYMLRRNKLKSHTESQKTCTIWPEVQPSIPIHMHGRSSHTKLTLKRIQWWKFSGLVRSSIPVLKFSLWPNWSQLSVSLDASGHRDIYDYYYFSYLRRQP